MKDMCPEVNLPTPSCGGTRLELMTSHNEVLIPCLGPLAASSLGPNGYSEQSRGADLNLSIDPSLFRPPSFPACVPRSALVDTGHRIPQRGPTGPCQERKEVGIVFLHLPGGRLADLLPLRYCNWR